MVRGEAPPDLICLSAGFTGWHYTSPIQPNLFALTTKPALCLILRFPAMRSARYAHFAT
jgi:hypothetical protein